MAKVIVVAHSDHRKNGDLTDLGKSQAINLACSVVDYSTDAGVVAILSASPRQSQETAKVLQKALSKIAKVVSQTSSVLWADDEHELDFAAVKQLIWKWNASAQVIVLVTDQTVAGALYMFFARLAGDTSFEGAEVGHGDLFVFDERARTVTHQLAAELVACEELPLGTEVDDDDD